MIEISKNGNLYNLDCVKAMRNMSDNYFDIAIVDPPYGINCLNKNGMIGGGFFAKPTNYGYKTWDKSIPKKEYFDQVKRISKNQIIFGGNYFLDFLDPTPCFIVWDKDRSNNFSDCELAWTSFNSPTRKIKFTWDGFRQENMRFKEKRIHPTQKPVGLYRWILDNYTKKGESVIDTHAGSCSLWIACLEKNRNFVGFEIDKDYYVKSMKRLKNYKKNQNHVFDF